MLTRRGGLLLASSIVCGGAGWLFGVRELTLFATAGAVFLAVGMLYVVSIPIAVVGSRTLRPTRVHVGGHGEVEIALENRSRRRTAPLLARDRLPPAKRSVTSYVPPIDSGQVQRARYVFPTHRRGVFSVGPLTVAGVDPLGLAKRTRVVADTTAISVLPRLDLLNALPRTPNEDLHAGANRLRNRLGSGQEFRSLRRYVPGDDIRRVHWASSARTDNLMVREDDTLWQARCTVFTDLRNELHTSETLEDALSAAASIVNASWLQCSLIRLVDTGGDYDSGFGSDRSRIDAMYEHLTAAGASPAGEMASMVNYLRVRGDTGVLCVLTTAALSDDDLAAITQLRSGFGAIAVVLFGAAARSHRNDHARPAGVSVIPVRSSVGFARSWDAAFGARRA